MRHVGLSQNGAKGLKVLRERIAAAEIPASRLDETFNLATWNIRDFGKTARTSEAIHFLAEVLNQFDLIAITELRRDVSDLSKVMRILGPYWKVVYSDYIADWGGNWERVAYLYDKRMITFTGLAAEADPPREKINGEYVAKYGWWRSPYIASFRAGTFDFMLIASHMRWGDSKDERRDALEALANWVKKRCDDEHVVDHDIILLGDFNIPSVKETDELFKAITSTDLRIPPGLVDIRGTNLSGRNRYDQILHFPRQNNNFTGNGGVLDVYKDDYQILFPDTMESNEDLTWQMSDHLPLWVQIQTDTEDEELDQLLAPPRRG
jgi:exonuclease III